MSARNLARYAPWQARDYLFERGIPVLIICTLFGWLTYGAMAGMRDGLGPEALRQLAVALWRSIVPQVALFGTILALNGIVATDLRQGYFRFLFAKPVSAPAYYAQSYAINGLSLGAITLLFFHILARLLGIPTPVWAAGYVLLYFVALGGIVFLASSASVSWLGRFDWLVASALWAGGVVTHELALRGQRWARLVAPVLPPSWRTDEVFQALVAGVPPPTEPLVHLLAYGAVCFLLGLIVLRYRPLAA